MKRLVLFVLVLTLAGLLFSACSSTPDLDDMDEWDLVWISDSTGWGVADIYADYIEEDTGKTVIVHDLWVGGLAAGEILDALNGNPPMEHRELKEALTLIPEAEVIVVFGNPEMSKIEDNPWDWFCLDGASFYVTSCAPDTYDLYVQHLGEIYGKILELRDGQPTILRTYDAYNPIIPQRVGQTGYQDCIDCWGNFNAAIHQAAAANNIPIALVADAWNGPDFLQNPKEMGYTRVDGIHPNEVGGEVIAQLLRELGYEPVEP
jgi:hypothetical protein